MTLLTLEIASAMIDAALAAARDRNTKPLCVVVLDPGAHLLALKRQETASLFRPQIAIAKATGALGMGMGSRALAGRAAQSPAFFAALSAATEGQIVPVPGGVLIRDQAGSLLGAMGISGDTSDLDEDCAVLGIEAAGLVADTGAEGKA